MKSCVKVLVVAQEPLKTFGYYWIKLCLLLR